MRGITRGTSMPQQMDSSPQIDFHPPSIPPYQPSLSFPQNRICPGLEGTLREAPPLLLLENGPMSSFPHPLCHQTSTARPNLTFYNQARQVAPSYPFTAQIPNIFTGWNRYVSQWQSYCNSAFNTSAIGIPPWPTHPGLLPFPQSLSSLNEECAPQFAASLQNRDSDVDHPKSEEPSLGDFSNEDSKAVKFQGKAAKRRNVYKSCVRHMYCYTSKNKAKVMTELKAEGYSTERIDHAFEKVAQYSNIEKHRGQRLSAQKIMKKIIEKKSIYTYILMGTLKWMLDNWENGEIGKMFRKNISVYREVCGKYLEAAKNVLHPASPIRRVS